MNAILALVLRVLFLILIYIFVGWISFVIFKDLKTHFQYKPFLVTQISLRANIEGENVEKIFSIPEIILGRDPDCDYSISDETVSLKHCKLTYKNKQWWAQDLDSTNGSYINDTIITSPIIVAEGDELRLGKIPITIQIIH
jgi:pSer/pThr/pTyr-binding forkhead associated (FHA) protein